MEAAAVSEYLQTIEAKGLDKARCEVTDSIRQADIERLSMLARDGAIIQTHTPPFAT